MDTFGTNTGSPVPTGPIAPAQTNQSTGGNAVIPTGGAVGTPLPATPSLPPTISSSNISSASPISVGTPPTIPNPNYTAQSQATIDNINGQITAANVAAQSPTDAGASDLQSLFSKYLGSQTPPPSGTETYNNLYNSSGIDTKQQALTKSQNELGAINAQLAGLNYNKDTVIPNQDIQNGVGRMSVNGVQGQIAIDQRQALLQIAPLQFQALIKQAEVTGNQNILDAAQKHLDTMFQIQSQDATNQYNYQKDLRDKVYQFATDAEKRTLDAQQHVADQAHQDLQDTIKNAQDLAKTAIENGQPELAAKISALDPKSSTYKQDLSKIEGTLKGKVDTSIQEIGGRKVQIITDTQGNIIKKTDLGPTTSSTTPTEAETLTTNTTNNVIDGSVTLASLAPTTGVPNANYQNVVAKLTQLGFFSDTPPSWYIQAQNAQFGGNALPDVIQSKWSAYRQKALGTTS